MRLGGGEGVEVNPCARCREKVRRRRKCAKCGLMCCYRCLLAFPRRRGEQRRRVECRSCYKPEVAAAQGYVDPETR